MPTAQAGTSVFHNNIQIMSNNVTVFPLPAWLADACPVVALTVLLTARVARSLVTRSADPALLTLALALGADAMAATWHRAQLGVAVRAGPVGLAGAGV